jgi:hypothetical protein
MLHMEGESVLSAALPCRLPQFNQHVQDRLHVRFAQLIVRAVLRHAANDAVHTLRDKVPLVLE